MIYTRITDGNIVIATTILKPSNMDGWVVVDGTLPPRPIAEDDTEPRLMLVDGALVWQVGKTADEIAEERKKAYVAECDPYLVAYQGYLVEGDKAKAESARKAYLKAKAEVRKRLPYAE
jgi:hypothetical protein